MDLDEKMQIHAKYDQIKSDSLVDCNCIRAQYFYKFAHNNAACEIGLSSERENVSFQTLCLLHIYKEGFCSIVVVKLYFQINTKYGNPGV
jgi:hypothetical protein